jgi:hypothetical protein
VEKTVRYSRLTAGLFVACCNVSVVWAVAWLSSHSGEADGVELYDFTNDLSSSMAGELRDGILLHVDTG